MKARTVPVTCHLCGGDLEFIVDDRDGRRTTWLVCPAHGVLEHDELVREPVVALLCGPGEGSGVWRVGEVWARAD